MNLKGTQRAFMAQVLTEDAHLPAGWDDPRMSAGLAIYRADYRSRLVEALGETFPRTRDWVGEASFARAAAHHLIEHPPSHWSLDLVGRGFAETLAVLFAYDPEVAELAQLEWDMHIAFVAADAPALDAAGFAAATASFTEEDWAGACLVAAPSLTVRPLRSKAAAIWNALAEGTDAPEEMLLPLSASLLVWREGLTPVFRSAELEEAACLELLVSGGSFGAVCEWLAEQRQDGSAATRAGAMLGRWLQDGLIVGVR